MDKGISNKIYYLYFALTLGMVMYHGSGVDTDAINYLSIIDHKLLYLYLRFASHIGTVCMVFFFFMSAFWLYKGLNSGKDLRTVGFKRIKTLLIPFILWNIIILLYKITYDGLSFRFKDLFYYFFQHPIAGPLWYILGLLILQLFSPIVLFLKKYKVVITLLFCIISTYIIARNLNYIPKFLSFKNWWWYENLIFYTPVYLIGAYFGLYHNSLIIEKDYSSKKYTIIGIVLLTLSFVLWHFLGEINYNLLVAYSLIELVGVWFVLKSSHCNKSIHELLNCNFYVFALHNPILLPKTQNLVNIFVNHHRVFGLEMVFIKILQIIVVFIIAMLVKYIVSKLFNKKVSYYLTGGR